MHLHHRHALLLTAAVALCCLAPVQSFGHSLLPQFALASNYTNLNHGSYGAPPIVVLEAAYAAELQMEANPDAFFRYDVWSRMDAIRERMAAYIGANSSDLVFIPNASNGVNAVIRSLRIPEGMFVLRLNLAYTMVKNTIDFVDGADVLVVNITLPTDGAGVVDAVRRVFLEYPGQVYLASFSHIVSLPAMILPVAELTQLCHSQGALVLIDGAHALGHIPVNVTALNADFWLANGHKWLTSPKGSALLWVRADRQSLIEPPVISWEGVGATHFQKAFSYTGTASYSPYLAMGAALDFRATLGDAAMMEYCHTLAVQLEAGTLLAAAWDTDVLFLDPDLYGAMVDVRVPTQNATLAAVMPVLLLSRFGTWVPVYDLGSLGGAKQNTFYVRVSLQVYSEISDVQMLASAVSQLIAESRPPSGGGAEDSRRSW